MYDLEKSVVVGRNAAEVLVEEVNPAKEIWLIITRYGITDGAIILKADTARELAGLLNVAADFVDGHE